MPNPRSGTMVQPQDMGRPLKKPKAEEPNTGLTALRSSTHPSEKSALVPTNSWTISRPLRGMLGNDQIVSKDRFFDPLTSPRPWDPAPTGTVVLDVIGVA
ncbi:MAG: hypothetical protein CM1200mP22_10980 [Dehalococcoidia bacterium]|nr:MAG: hypothetical protein CM1200mP22_10980 [Dehalococcoidia bacterium]